MKQYKLSVVIPAYNEVKNFNRGVLEEVYNYLKKQKYTWEVILVNDGSADKTLSLFKDFVKKHPGFKVLDIPHGGKVAAVSAGIKEASGEYVLFTDFDQSTPISQVGPMLKKFALGADVVIGQRLNKTIGWNFYQKLRSKVFNLLTQLIVLPGISDTQCGFKAFKNEVGKILFDNLVVTKKKQSGGYMGAFDVEVLYLARKMGYRIETLKVDWIYHESNRLSTSEPIKMLKDIIQVRMIDLFLGYKNTSPKISHFIPILLLFFFSIPAFINTVVPGYFSMHDDLQIGRQVIMDKCFADGQLPCRWSTDLGYGYGYPMFNFYPPFPYYVGQIFRIFDFQYIDIVKILVVLNFLVSGLTMYILSQTFWGKKGGLISGLFYIYAPYHAVDVYVRGAMNEAWALTWFPLILWSIYRLVEKKRWIYVLWLALSTALLMLSHNIMLMIFTPFAIVWTIFWLIKFKSLYSVPKLIIGGVWALGLAAFFTIPVIFEQKYAHVETLIIGYFNYLAHFVSLKQLFIDTNWGFGASVLGIDDGMSFQIGYLHWIFAGFALLVAFYLGKKKTYLAGMILLVLLATAFYTFLLHERSSFIWSAVTQLHYLQFPWRMLSMTIFGTSFLAGSIVVGIYMVLNWIRDYFKFNTKLLSNMIFIGIIIGTIYLYQGYFKWSSYNPHMTDEDKLTGQSWQLQITSGIFDYLPIWAPLPPAKPPRADAEILDGGNGTVDKIFKNSIKQEYLVKLQSNSIFQINTFYFPGFRYFINDVEVKVDPEDDQELGRPRFNLLPGEYRVRAVLEDTPIRYFSDKVSLISWGIMIVLLLLYIRSTIIKKLF